MSITSKTKSLGRSRELILVSGLVLIAWFLRVWLLGSKGLWYDEAITALISRATLLEIIQYHWTSTFEHPPLWMLTMREWSLVFGQSETMLRLPSALAGTLTVPLSWVFWKRLWLHDRTTPLLATILVTFSPVLLEYSQEARMYSLAVALSLLSLYALLRVIQVERFAMNWHWVLVYVLANWLLTGLHYYLAATLFLSEGLIIVLTIYLKHRLRIDLLVFLLLSGIPLLLWVLLSPGFNGTVDVVGVASEEGSNSYLQHLESTWRDFTFGNVRHLMDDPYYADLRYLLLPFLIFGIVVAIRRIYGLHFASNRIPGEWLLIVTLFVPWFISLTLFQTLNSRYVLPVVLPLYALLALAVTSLWRGKRLAALIAGVVIGSIFLSGTVHYFTIYRKSDYREMTAYLRTHFKPDSQAIIIEAPRQHLLAKYYMGSSFNVQPIPNVQLPGYFPVNAPLIVPAEVSNNIQEALKEQQALWVIFTGEDEVDAGGFLPSYLSAVTYSLECTRWLDVRLCHFLNPVMVDFESTVLVSRVFNSDLKLDQAKLSVLETESTMYLLVEFMWEAVQQPTIDYKVTVRLIDEAGNTIVQKDDFPIGPLLPPTAWSASDVKPGYWAVPASTLAGVSPGAYTLVVGLYDPVTLAPILHTGPDGIDTTDFIPLGTLKVDNSNAGLTYSVFGVE